MSGSTSYRVGVRIDGNASGLSRAAQEAQRAQRLLAGGAQREFQRMHDARRTLGVRAEREVQREIQQTEAAYNRLARSGKLSWQEQRMAAKSMREEVTRLTNEMGRLTTRQKLAMGAKGVAAVGAGVGIATALAAPKVNRALEYDQRIGNLANTAYNERDTAGRRAGMSDLNAMIVDAVRKGGGTRDQALTTAEALFGAGIFKPGEIKGILREAVRAGTANNADPAAFAQMAISANQTLGIRPEQMSRMFGMGTFAGQEGGFEIKDMARWLPQQMAAAKAVGMSGEAGFAKLAALNQAAVVTAGTKDEAGNNVVNLLAKLGSQDTAKDFKKQGINLPKELAEGRMKGLDALDVLGNLLAQQLAKDKNYQQAQKQLQSAKNDEQRREALTAVSGIAQGTLIGKVFQDRQALMALYGFVNGRDRVNKITQGAMDNTGASEKNFDLISSLPSFQVNQRREESEIAMQSSIDKLTPAIGVLNEKVTGLMREYPGYTTAVIGATGALVALAGSAAAAAGMAWLSGRRVPGVGGGPIVPPAAGGAAAGAGAGAASAASKLATGGGRLASMLGAAGKIALPLTVLAGLVTTSDEELEVLRNADRRKQGYRGRGLEDPRIAAMQASLGSSPTVSERQAHRGQISDNPRIAAPGMSEREGHRGRGFEDPRIAAMQASLGGARTMSERLGSTKSDLPILREELKGEILVRVTGAPGLNVQAETKTNSPRIPFRTDVGRSMLGSGA